MLGRKRAFALICLAVLASSSAFAAEWIDTTKLPRLPGSTDIFVNPSTTQFTVPVSVPLAAEATVRLLTEAGWQQYGRPFSGKIQDPNMAILEFKKGRDGLSVFINVAPAQGYATAVGYTASALTTNLPFPPNATNVEFDHERPHLNAMTQDSADDTLEFFRKELVSLKWIPWSLKEGANPVNDAAGVKTEKGGYAYYVRDAGRPFATPPLQLWLQNQADGRIKIELKGVPAEALMVRSEQGHDTPEYAAYETKRQAAVKAREEAEAKQKAEAEARRAEVAARIAQQKAESDRLAQDINRQANQAIADAMSQIRTVAKPPVRVAQGEPDKQLAMLADNPAPIPVPDTAEEVDYDGRSGKLEFESKSSVQSLAAFYRAALKQQGWREKPTVINRPNMVSLDFSKQNAKLDFTIMQMGPKVNVSASGSGLITVKAVAEQSSKSSAQASTQSGGSASMKVTAGVRINPSARVGSSVTVTSTVKESTNSDDFSKSAEKKNDDAVLEAEADSALPAPTRHTQLGTEKTPFRVKLTASIPAELPKVLAFYRNELGKLNWKESSGAVIKSDEATLAFTAPEGPATLTLGRKDDETTVELSLRKQTEAQKAGMLPKEGQAKLLFGNMVPSEAVVTINKQTIKVAAGAGAKKPDGPVIDLPPGKYKYAIRIGGKAAQTEEVEVGAGETWGLMIGPGGSLTLQVY